MKDIKTRYEAQGDVIGYLWGSGLASYPSRTIKANTIDKINKAVYEWIKTGSLNSGMGFKSLIGAEMNIVKIHTTIIDGKEFKHEEISYKKYGETKEDVLWK